LGARALYLFTKAGDTGFRVHGTNEPDSIGTAASSGCIRMLNEEVAELYDSVPIGSKVIVI
jgi:lipoprotein-anchoring transpeptidase ErfK/SrfK